MLRSGLKSGDKSMQALTPMTYAESFQLPENRFEEIVNGEPRIMPTPTWGHNRLLQRLEVLLSAGTENTGWDIAGPGVGLGISKEPFTTESPDKMVSGPGLDSVWTIQSMSGKLLCSSSSAFLLPTAKAVSRNCWRTTGKSTRRRYGSSGPMKKTAKFTVVNFRHLPFAAAH